MRFRVPPSFDILFVAGGPGQLQVMEEEVDVVGLTSAKLRLSPTKNKQEKNVRGAKEYEL